MGTTVNEKYNENAKEIQLSRKEYKERTKTQKAETDKKYRLNNLVKIQNKIKLWCEENPEKLRTLRRKRKAQVRNATLENISTQDYINIKEHFNNKCVYCAKSLTSAKIHWDHVQPIIKDGKHCKSNLVPSCDRCNLSKNAKLLNDWYPLQPFYRLSRYIKILHHIKDIKTLKAIQAKQTE